MNLRHDMMGLGVGECVHVPGICVLKMMLRYGTLSWKLRHVKMGSGEGGCVKCYLNCFQYCSFVFQQSVAPATPNGFYSALKRLLKAN